MVAPHAFLVGAAKAGTTTLAVALARHPGIHVNNGDGRGSELSWFAGRYSDRDLDWYEAHFETARPGQVRVDYSTAYSRHPRTDPAPRIAAYAPDARIVYQVREPIERMRSHWRMRVREGKEQRTFATAVRASDYPDISSYGMQLQRYLDHFPASAVHVTTTDAMSEDLDAVVRRIGRVLGARGEPSDAIEQAPRNVGGDRRTPARIRSLARTNIGRRLRAALPSTVTARVRDVATSEVTYPDDRLPDALVAELRDHFAADLQVLRPLMPPTWDAWGLFPSS